MTWSRVNTFIPDRDPQEFGAHNQKDYRAWMIRRQQKEGQRIKLVPKEEPALVDFFHTLIERLSQSRMKIAHRQHHLQAKCFGLRRDQNHCDGSYRTPFIRGWEYGIYNEIILQRLVKEIDLLNIFSGCLNPCLDCNDIKQKKVENVYKNFASTLEVQIFEDHQLQNFFDFDRLPEWYPFDLKEESDENLSKIEKEWLYLMDMELERTHPDIYRDFKFFDELSILQSDFPSHETFFLPNGESIDIPYDNNLKNMYVKGALSLHVGGETYETTKWLTWLFRDGKTPPEVRMLERSSVNVIHMNQFYIDKTLKKIACLFAKAVCAGNDNLAEMQENVGLMRYYLAHCSPWERGSSAIGEALEGAVYNACGYDVWHNSNMTVDLEALSTPELSLFMKKYPKMIKLTYRPFA